MKTAIVLAAGDGKRMRSAKPKVLAEVLFTPMLVWVLDNAVDACVDRVGIVVGNGAEIITARIGGEHKRGDTTCPVTYYTQDERNGTAHAVAQAMPLVRDTARASVEASADVAASDTASGAASGDVLVMCGDAPFMESEYINAAYDAHKASGNAVTVISADTANPRGYGRIVREGELVSIVEEKDCTDAQRDITEINSGAYWFNAAALADILPLIGNDNNSGEYSLTAALMVATRLGRKAGAYNCGTDYVVLGANDRRSLYELNENAAARVINKHLDNGVEIVGTNIYIGKDVTIGADTTVLANCILRGGTHIGSGCVIGMNTILDDCVIGNNVVLDHVRAAETAVCDDVRVGPFVQLRPGTVLKRGVKIGDFVEIKNSSIGEKTSIAHLTYIGDSDVGNSCNFGCGCVTANYDGLKKYRTQIGDRCFIGCNTNLIAPVKIGDDVITAAGTTVTREIPSGSLAIGRCKETILEGWTYDKFKDKQYK